MKAIVWTQYGPPEVLQLQEIEQPVPQDDEVLIRVHAVTVSMGDCEMRTLKFPFWVRVPMQLYVGIRKPQRVPILGGYLAGKIAALGKAVTQLRVGDQVFGFTGLRFGGYAEYVCLPATGAVIPKPANASFAESAPVALGGLEALHFLRQAHIQPGQKVLINGAGGSIGTFAVQLAKHFGAEVTAVDRPGKLAMLRSLGADHVVDYTREDFSQNGAVYDVILDVVMTSSFSKIIASLKETGIYLMANPTLIKMFRGAWISRTTGKKVIFQFNEPNTDNLAILKELMEAGKLKTVIDRQYALAQIPDAHYYVETGDKQGDVVVIMEPESKT